MNAPVNTTIESRVHAIQQALDRRQFSQVLEESSLLLEQVPENRDVLYARAIALRFLGRGDACLAILDRLQELHPQFSRQYQERGLCHVARREAPQAVDAFLRAVRINPALPTSWNMLESLYRMTGRDEDCATAAAHGRILASLAPQVREATSLFSEGDIDPAEALIRSFLLTEPENIEAMRLLARIGLARGVLDDAEVLLENVLTRAPDYRAARTDYLRTLVERHRFAQARAQVALLTAAGALDREQRALAAAVDMGLGDHDSALAAYDALVADATPGPEMADLYLSKAHALKTIGRLDEAVIAYRTATGLRPDFGDAYWSLANLKTYRFSEVEIEAMLAHESAATTGTTDLTHLCFALGKAFEDLGRHEASWACYERGNRLRHDASHYRPESMELNTTLQKRICTVEFFRQRQSWGSPAEDPIFIVGLPRSGSTLIEQILASHPMVEGTQELADIPRLALELQGRDSDPENPGYPGAMADLGPDDALRLGERYLRDTRVYRQEGRPRFIDKMPNNFRHLGLIRLILPKARIIDARREPMACCFSNFKQLFASGQEFTYNLDAIARYYRTYLDLMRHWHQVLPGHVLTVQHEDVLDDLETSVRSILAFCGLPFDERCLDFHKTARSVRTPSSEQVRRPIFRDSIDQWRNYAPWLEPLKASLGDAVTQFRN